MHVYRWDLDRTYLDTAIHSMRGLLRSAFEDAARKRALPGATTLLQGLVASNPDGQVCILSGSPEQMRGVLEQKLALDGIEFHKLILKDNLGNLRRGRLRAIRGQVGYKLPALLAERLATEPRATETLFGDDSEADALIYVTYAEVVAGRVQPDVLVQVLERSGAYSDHVAQALAACAELSTFDAVDGVFIRLDRRTPPDRFHSLGRRVIPVHHWLQAGFVLWERARITTSVVALLASEVIAQEGAWAFEGLVQDTVRRGLIERSRLDDLSNDGLGESLTNQMNAALAHMPTTPLKPPHPDRPDLVGFLDSLA